MKKTRSAQVPENDLVVSSGNNDSCTSRLLMWPRKRRRQQRQDSGFVLGWKHCNHHRETVICAGILPSTRSLQEYRDRIEELKEYMHKHNQCDCVLQDLDIVAIWSANPSRERIPTTANDSLPIITRRKGYPWWQQKYNHERHHQLVFYDPPALDNPYAHYYSPNGSTSTPTDTVSKKYHVSSWPHQLYQLNRANDILQLLASNSFTSSIKTAAGSPPLSQQQRQQQQQQQQPDKREDDTALTTANDTWWRPLVNLMYLCLNQSMTWLHICNIYQQQQQQQQRQQSTFLHWFSCLSLVRCLQTSPPPIPKHSAIIQFQNDDDGTTNDSVSCSTCHKVSLSSFRDRRSHARYYMKRWDDYIAAILDMSLGIGIASLLFMAWRYPTLSTSSSWTYYCKTVKHYSMHRFFGTLDNNQSILTWLESFPVGFKLNVPLTQQMGYGIRYWMTLQEPLWDAIFWNITTTSTMVGGKQLWLGCFWILSVTCGSSTLLAICMDLWRLQMIHVSILAIGFTNIYAAQLSLLAALFRLFCGTKRNRLRQRTDTMPHDAMQLLVGTIGFCICIFLWTTMMVYHFYFQMVSILLCHVPMIVLWILYCACGGCIAATGCGDSPNTVLPIGSVVWRLLHPEWCSQNVHLESIVNESTDNNPQQLQRQNDSSTIEGCNCSVSRLVSTAESPMSMILERLSPAILPMMKWTGRAIVNAIIPKGGGDSSSATPPLASLMKQSNTSSTNNVNVALATSHATNKNKKTE